MSRAHGRAGATMSRMVTCRGRMVFLGRPVLHLGFAGATMRTCLIKYQTPAVFITSETRPQTPKINTKVNARPININ